MPRASYHMPLTPLRCFFQKPAFSRWTLFHHLSFRLNRYLAHISQRNTKATGKMLEHLSAFLNANLSLKPFKWLLSPSPLDFTRSCLHRDLSYFKHPSFLPSSAFLTTVSRPQLSSFASLIGYRRSITTEHARSASVSPPRCYRLWCGSLGPPCCWVYGVCFALQPIYLLWHSITPLFLKRSLLWHQDTTFTWFPFFLSNYSFLVAEESNAPGNGCILLSPLRSFPGAFQPHRHCYHPMLSLYLWPRSLFWVLDHPVASWTPQVSQIQPV